ncbi:MAG: T9SS type A sorting domain-containing protein [Sphingobacteriales bacterium]|nr:MAG: T9SS type A sorting domain-containing protein [Sphingobacteriales bacterium]
MVTFVVPCNDPDVPSLPSITICQGISVSISVPYNLNDATDWYLYKDACGGVPEAVSATGNFTLMPNVTTTYFLRGEGGCVVPGPCGAFTLTVNAADATVTQTGNTLSANAAGALYQWVDCNNGNSPVQGATSQSFTPTISGTYAVIVTSGSCQATSVCTPVIINGTSNTEETNFSIYPNPACNFLKVVTPQETSGAIISIVNATGQTVYSGALKATVSDIRLPELPAGLYLVKVTSANKKFIARPLHLIR